MSYSKKINWNLASKLGLVYRINHEVLHPLGLAMCRDPDTGTSPYIFVSTSEVWAYSKEIEKKPRMSDSDILEYLKEEFNDGF